MSSLKKFLLLPVALFLFLTIIQAKPLDDLDLGTDEIVAVIDDRGLQKPGSERNARQFGIGFGAGFGNFGGGFGGYNHYPGYGYGNYRPQHYHNYGPYGYGHGYDHGHHGYGHGYGHGYNGYGHNYHGYNHHHYRRANDDDFGPDFVPEYPRYPYVAYANEPLPNPIPALRPENIPNEYQIPVAILNDGEAGPIPVIPPTQAAPLPPKLFTEKVQVSDKVEPIKKERVEKEEKIDSVEKADLNQQDKKSDPQPAKDSDEPKKDCSCCNKDEEKKEVAKKH